MKKLQILFLKGLALVMFFLTEMLLISRRKSERLIVAGNVISI
jgi:hypothetical protein